MKFILKISIALMCCSIFMFNFIGCRNYEKENKEALKYLNNKYGKEFELNGNFKSIYADEFYQSPVKDIEVWPKDNPEEIFKVEFYPESGFKDNYQNIEMKPYVDRYLSNMVKEYWSECKVFIYLRLGLVNEKFSNNDCLKFLSEGKVDIRLSIYLKYDDTFNIDNEVNKIKSLCDYFKNSGFNGYINIMYVSRDISDNEINYNLWNNLKKEGVSIKEYITKCGKYYYDEEEEITTETIEQELKNNTLEDN